MINFNLPENLIAKTPAKPRDSAKLLVYEKQTGKIKDSIFKEINKFLPKNTTLVINNSKVEHCRWLFNHSKTEVFVLSKDRGNVIEALVRPGKKFKAGMSIELEDGITAHVLRVNESGTRTLELSIPYDSEYLKNFEHVPLPPYIPQDDSLADEYQTVYAKSEGSKAAPTAGLHFTAELLKETKNLHDIAEVTLHVGMGTFSPLTEEQLSKGKLHSEWYSIDVINQAKLKSAEHITAVGTTSTRTIESVKAFSEKSVSGNTDILIKPGYEFKHTNSLVTNFHLPGTSLLLLVEAFVGSDTELLKIYEHAINNNYRFYSFGDAMLII